MTITNLSCVHDSTITGKQVTCTIVPTPESGAAAPTTATAEKRPLNVSANLSRILNPESEENTASRLIAESTAGATIPAPAPASGSNVVKPTANEKFSKLSGARRNAAIAAEKRLQATPSVGGKRMRTQRKRKQSRVKKN
jgi:hypothetical protein